MEEAFMQVVYEEADRIHAQWDQLTARQQSALPDGGPF
jgi:hypothetical protein